MEKFGKWAMIISTALLILCVAPIMLYSTFGPADGNPVGLGLLMVYGGSVFGAALLTGAIVWIIGILRGSP